MKISKNTVGSVSPKARVASSFVCCLLALLTLSLSGGCALYRVNLKEQLANQGPQSLSAENPYVAANQLLAEEIESSATLRGFVSIRGTPDALEVKQDLTLSPVLLLYYLDKTESYRLERLLNDWVIKGPDIIPREFLGSFFGLTQTEGKAPLVLSGEVVRQVAAPKPTMRTTSTRTIPGAARSTADNSIPQVRQIEPPTSGNDLSNESLSGDVKHTVQFQGETLRIISTWYTGSAENADRLGRINGLSDPNHLELGQTIRIPRYLTRNTQTLTESEFQRLLTARNRN